MEFLTSFQQRRIFAAAHPQSRPAITPEWLLRWAGRRWIAGLALLALLGNWIQAREGEDYALRSHGELEVVVLTTAAVGLILLFVDILTYRPQLFALAAPGREPHALFSELSKMSEELERIYQEVTDSKPATWHEVSRHETNLLREASHYYLLDRLRMLVTLAVVSRIVLIVLALALLAHGLDGVTDGRVFTGLDDAPGFLQMVYSTVGLVFTFGFGEFAPIDPWGYFFACVCVLVLVLVSYFVIAEIVSSYSEFETNVRDKAHRYVMSIASI